MLNLFEEVFTIISAKKNKTFFKNTRQAISEYMKNTERQAEKKWIGLPVLQNG